MSINMTTLTDLFESVLWLSWQGTLLTFVVAAGLMLTGRWLSARWRYWVWSLVLVRLLLFWGVASSWSLYSLTNSSSSLNNWPPIVAETETAIAPATSAPLPIIEEQPSYGSPEITFERQPEFEAIPEGPTSVAAVDTAMTVPKPAPALSPVVISRWSWDKYLWPAFGILWLAGVWIASLRFVVEQWYAWRHLSHANKASDEILRLVDQLAKQAGLRRGLDVRVLSGNLGPAVSGLVYPVLYLPQWMLEDLPREQLCLAIRHELAHVRRWDVFMLWVTVLVRIIHWFNPFVRWAIVRLQQECELACDEYVLTGLDSHQRKAYGTVLLRVVEQCLPEPMARGSLGFSRSGDLLKRRVEMIGRFRMTSPWTNLAAATLLALLTVVGLTDGVAQVNENKTDGQTQEVKSSSEEPKETQQATVKQPTVAEQIDEPKADDGPVEIVGVCEDTDARPIPNATVTIYSREVPVGSLDVVATTQTDQTGKFQITVDKGKIAKAKSEDGQVRMLFSVNAIGYASLQLPFSISDADKFTKAVLGKRAKPLRGIVTDHNYIPLANAWIFHSNSLRYPIPGVLSAISDEHGRFELYDHVDTQKPPQLERFEGKYKVVDLSSVARLTLLTKHPDYPIALTKVEVNSEEVWIRFKQGATITGKVVDDVTGMPAANCIVSALNISRSPGGDVALTDKNGLFYMKLEEGKYNIWAEMEDRMPIALDGVELQAGKHVVASDIRLVRGGFVQGRVVDFVTGQPVQKDQLKTFPISVGHYGPARPRSGGGAVTHATVDNKGNYRIRVAPGDNHIYVMSEELKTVHRSQRTDINGMIPVKDGETVQLDFVVRRNSTQDKEWITLDMSGLRFRRIPFDFSEIDRSRGVLKRDWPDTTVGRLLKKLEYLQEMRRTGYIEWAETMRELILLGADAVPELVITLDATPAEDRRMLRSIPFVLRAIGEKRAIPALIRAIPRCFGQDGPEMYFQCEEDGLLFFMREHDISLQKQGDRYRYGRPLHEICHTLEQWTGLSHGWHELNLVSMSYTATPKQQHLGQRLFDDLAVRWQQWWEEHNSKVELPVTERTQPTNQVDLTKLFRRVDRSSGHIAASVFDSRSQRIFFDLDTGRYAGLPNYWQNCKKEELTNLRELITGWAQSQGFDLMGTQVESQGQIHYAIEAIGMKTWEIPATFWDSDEPHTAQAMFDAGRPVDKLLTRQGSNQNRDDLNATGPFLFITSEGTIGQVFLGSDVLYTNVADGPSPAGDVNLNPVGPYRGKRFGVAIFAEAE